MELFCALLTGFFLWLTVFHWHRKARRQSRRWAGDLVLKVDAVPVRRPFRDVIVGLLFCIQVTIAATMFLDYRNGTPGLGFAVQFALILLLTILLERGVAFEVRANGLLTGLHSECALTGRLSFVPWNRIVDCKWIPSSVPNRDDTHSHFLIAEDTVAPDQKAVLTAALGRFVPVYDCDGALLAEPAATDNKKLPAMSEGLVAPRFQFDLQTMLLLMVAVACAASLFQVCYRNPHDLALKRLRAFAPDLWCNKEYFNGLDFSHCATKPADADLADVALLTELRVVDLQGAPITDDGLMHLRRAKNLRFIDVTDTAVTSEGARELANALPNVQIRYGPSKSPIEFPGRRPP